MNKNYQKQILLNVIQIGETQKLNHLTIHEVISFMKRNHDLNEKTVKELLKSLKYDGLINMDTKYVTYKGYDEQYPVCGE